MLSQASAGSQIPLFPEFVCECPPLLKAEKVELTTVSEPLPVQGEFRYTFPYNDCDGLLLSKNQTEVHLVTVDRVSERRRRKLVKAASYLSRPTPQEVKKLFGYYAPGVDPETVYGRVVFDHFLEMYLLAAKAGLLLQFLDRALNGKKNHPVAV